MQLRAVFDQIVQFETDYSNICSQALEERETRKLFAKRAAIVSFRFMLIHLNFWFLALFPKTVVRPPSLIEPYEM